MYGTLNAIATTCIEYMYIVYDKRQLLFNDDDYDYDDNSYRRFNSQKQNVNVIAIARLLL